VSGESTRADTTAADSLVRQRVRDGCVALLSYVEQEKAKAKEDWPTNSADFWRWSDVGTTIRNAVAQLEAWR
jgi:hypothetical protein